MAKTDGGKARPTKRAGMQIQGAVRLVVKPEIFALLTAGKSAVIEFGTPGMGDGGEFILQVEPGSENKIQELTPWFNLDHAPIKVKNSVALDGRDFISDYFCVYLEESEDRNFGFLVNAKQARALAAVLINFAQACESIEALTAAPARA